MNLKYKVGNLITAAKGGEIEAFAHGCNCYCTMGSGIAPQIRQAFPEMFDSDQATEKGDHKKLGNYTWATMDGGRLIGFNLYSQYGFWGRNKGVRDLDYNALYDALAGMKSFLEQNTDQPSGGRRIGFPKIGAGLAGGDWKVIEVMIARIFHEDDVTIYVLSEGDIPND